MKKPWGQLAQKFSDLVSSKSISISEKHRKIVASEKNLVALAMPAVAILSSVLKKKHWKKKTFMVATAP